MMLTSNGIAVLEPEKDMGLSRWLELCESVSSYDPRIESTIAPMLPAGGWAIDGGAFLGSHSVAYAKAVGPSGAVFAFEPTPSHAECLCHNVRPFKQVHVIQAALYSERRRALWMCPNTHNAGATVVGSQDDLNSFEVEAVTIDSFEWARMDFIKLDVEGLVLRALEGAINTLRLHRPIVVAEVGDNLQLFGDFTEDVVDFMARLNYSSRVLPPMIGEKNSDDQCDILFTPKER